MRKTYTYRIYLTTGQRRLLEPPLALCRWVSTETLAERKRAYEERGERVRLYETQAMLPGWNRTQPALQGVPSQGLQPVQVRGDRAYHAFFQRVQRGADKVGFPRCNGHGRSDRITYPQYGNGVRLDGTRLILANVGAVQVVLHRSLAGTPKTVTIRRSRSGPWCVAFSCEVAANELHPTRAGVGVDVGLASFATFSTGEQIDNPRCYRRDAADLTRVQRRKDAAKNAENWHQNAKHKAIRATIHERIAHRRSDVAHQERRTRVNRFQVIAVEQLAPQELGKRRGMRKRIMDVAWSQCMEMTVSKAAAAGRRVIVIDPRKTSKMCARCGEWGAKTLSERVHACPHWGLVLDRAVHAAITMLQRGLPTLQP